MFTWGLEGEDPALLGGPEGRDADGSEHSLARLAVAPGGSDAGSGRGCNPRSEETM